MSLPVPAKDLMKQEEFKTANINHPQKVNDNNIPQKDEAKEICPEEESGSEISSLFTNENNKND